MLDEAKADLLEAKRLMPEDAKLNDALVKLRVRARRASARPPPSRAAEQPARLLPGCPRAAPFVATGLSRPQLQIEAYNRRSKSISAKMIDALHDGEGDRDDDSAPAADEARADARARDERSAEAEAATPAAADGDRLSAAEPAAQAPSLPRVGLESSSAYACLDCPADSGALRHPVLGPICARCRLVLVSNS
jgi:hypothetical protein